MTANATLTAGRAVAFQCEGMRLVGSLHQPMGQRSRIGVILLNQGPIDRSGSHRLYIKLAARLTQLGMPVLRFDARGVGESEGEWAAGGISVLEAYGHIQRGVWVPDTLAAIDFMRRCANVDRVVLGGLCGGAATALFAGADHPSVHGMLLIGTPVTFSSSTQQVAALPDSIIQRDTGEYLRKLIRPSSWKRFLSLETDYKTLRQVFAQQVRRQLRLGRPAEHASDASGNVNLPMFAAIATAQRCGKALLFVFGENDYLWQEFKEQLPRFGIDRDRLPFELVTIRDANHILTEEPWQYELFANVTSWLERITERRQQIA